MPQVDISAKNRLKKLRENKSEGEMSGPAFEGRLRSRYRSRHFFISSRKEETFLHCSGRGAQMFSEVGIVRIPLSHPIHSL